MRYEYRVVPAPTKGVKAKGLKTGEARFAQALEEVINQMAADGWEYQRTETLPSVERAGLTSTATHWRNLLVFRKIARAQAGAEPVRPRPPLAAEKPSGRAEPRLASKPQSPEEDASESEGASRMLRDNGVEEVSEVSGITNSLKRLAATRKLPNSDT